MEAFLQSAAAKSLTTSERNALKGVIRTGLQASRPNIPATCKIPLKVPSTSGLKLSKGFKASVDIAQVVVQLLTLKAKGTNLEAAGFWEEFTADLCHMQPPWKMAQMFSCPSSQRAEFGRLVSEANAGCQISQLELDAKMMPLVRALASNLANDVKAVVDQLGDLDLLEKLIRRAIDKYDKMPHEMSNPSVDRGPKRLLVLHCLWYWKQGEQSF
eukprot:gene5501-5540_t